MKRIKFFFIALLWQTTCCIALPAQDINISLSICDEALTPTDTLNPYLVINYRNNGSSPYYFPALSYSGYTVPLFSLGSFWGTTLPNVSRNEIIELLHQYHNSSFTLSLDYLESQNGEMWTLSQGDQWSFIDACLYLYYEPFYTYHEDVVFFTPDNYNKTCTLRKSRAFVFLKAGQTKEQKVSLRGMKEAGIILSIRLSSKNAPNAVFVRTPNGPKYGEYRSLPYKVKSYLLYSGTFNSNDLIVDFSNYFQPTIIGEIL